VGELAELAQLAELLAQLLPQLVMAPALATRGAAGDALEMQAGPIALLVLQPTPFCNLKCDYCYLPNRDSTRLMSMDTIDALFERLLEGGLVADRLDIVWHAGEPLVAPIGFYEAALDRIAELLAGRSAAAHSIQTNGVLLTSAWCELIKRRRIHVGVSLDGPAAIHDAHRKTRAGKGTHARVMRGVELLQQHEIDFHVIAVITAASLGAADEMFDFFRAHGIRDVGFNVEELEGVHRASSLEAAGTREAYRHFMRRIHELTVRSAGAVRIREFEWARALICHPPAVAHAAGIDPQVSPFRIVSVDCDGNLSTFSPELLGQQSARYGNFVFGNVRRDRMGTIIDSAGFRAAASDVAAGVELCRSTCEYFELCGGGAPANKYFEHGSFRAAETMYCRYAIQAPIDIVLDNLERSLGVATPGARGEV
jgi:uncharacterized protein